MSDFAMLTMSGIDFYLADAVDARIEALEAEVERVTAALRIHSNVLWHLHAAHAITLNHDRVIKLLQAIGKYQRRLEAHESNHEDDSDPLGLLSAALEGDET